MAIYNHVGNWTESLPFIIDVVRKVNHPQVGFNFNLCHWLKVDGAKDYRPLLRDNAGKLFCVMINGAQCGAEEWTNGLIQPLDKGDFDNCRLLTTLAEIGYRGPVGLMCYGVPARRPAHPQHQLLERMDGRKLPGAGHGDWPEILGGGARCIRLKEVAKLVRDSGVLKVQLTEEAFVKGPGLTSPRMSDQLIRRFTNSNPRGTES